MEQKKDRIDHEKRIAIINKVTRAFVPILILVAMMAIWYMKGDEGGKTPSASPSAAPAAGLFELDDTAARLNVWKAAELPVILAFGAESSADSQKQHAALEALQAEVRGKAVLKYVDIGAHPDAAKGYTVTVMPTLFFYDKDGKPYAPADPEALDMILYYKEDTKTHQHTAHEGFLGKDALRTVLTEMGME